MLSARPAGRSCAHTCFLCSKGVRLKYLVKWKGHEVQTHEPWQHLHKYGAKEVIEQYRIKNKMRTGKKANLANTEGKISTSRDEK